jgi:hypothetical protein
METFCCFASVITDAAFFSPAGEPDKIRRLSTTLSSGLMDPSRTPLLSCLKSGTRAGGSSEVGEAAAEAEAGGGLLRSSITIG